MPSSPPDFSSKSYWSNRFQSEERFEWLLPSHQISSYILENARLIHPPAPSSTSTSEDCIRVLHFGCGTSSLGRDIRDVLLSEYPIDKLEVVDADYATSALPAREPTDVPLIDLDLLSPIEDEEDVEQYDILVDKSTADAISCGPNLLHPDTNLQVEPIQVLCHNLAQMIRKGGRWICVSYSSSRFDWDVGKEGWKVVEKRGMKGWSGSLSEEEVREVKEEVGGEFGIGKKGGKRRGRRKEKEERVVYEPEVGVWVYVLERI